MLVSRRRQQNSKTCSELPVEIFSARSVFHTLFRNALIDIVALLEFLFPIREGHTGGFVQVFTFCSFALHFGVWTKSTENFLSRVHLCIAHRRLLQTICSKCRGNVSFLDSVVLVLDNCISASRWTPLHVGVRIFIGADQLYGGEMCSCTRTSLCGFVQMLSSNCCWFLLGRYIVFCILLLEDGVHCLKCTSTRYLSTQNQNVLNSNLSQESLSWFNGSYANRFPPLYHSLPGLKLPPSLPEYVEPSPTRVTTLPNGLKIASEDSPVPAACLGLFVDCGSIYESQKCTGVTHLLEKMAFKSTKNRSHLRIVREVEATGGNVGASASREQMGYTYDMLKTYIPEAVELLIDCIRNPVFVDSMVKEQVAKVKAEIRETLNNPQQFLLEALHPTGFSGALGNPLMAPESALDQLDGSAIERFYIENYTANRMVLAAYGVDHEELLALAKPLLNDLPSGSSMEVPKSIYNGGDFRYRADLRSTHVMLAFEVPGGWREEKDATTLTVLQVALLSLDLHVLNQYQDVQSFSAISNVYNDTDFVKKAVEVAVDELLSVATPGQVTELELQRAKNATKSAVFMNLESRLIVTEDIGRQILTYGCRSLAKAEVEVSKHFLFFFGQFKRHHLCTQLPTSQGGLTLEVLLLRPYVSDKNEEGQIDEQVEQYSLDKEDRKPVEHFLTAIDELSLDDLTSMAQKILCSPLTMGSLGDSNL
ncbi:hypothetical protein ACLOJK_034668 [Asimina triloba]